MGAFGFAAAILAVGIAGILYKANTFILQFADYNYVLERGVFNSNVDSTAGYLNMGLWIQDDLGALHGDQDAILKVIRENIAKAKPNANPVGFNGAQKRMYELFYALAGLKDKVKVLETGPGSCSHYLLWDRWGLEADMTAYEIYTKMSPAMVEERKKRNDDSALCRMERHQRSALTVGDDGDTYDRIMAVESAFHYPNRSLYFKKAVKALNPGGKFIMTDLLHNGNNQQNFLWKALWQYYWRVVITTPVENIISIDEYTRQMEAAGCSDLEVIDITSISLRVFYEKIDENLDIKDLDMLTKWFMWFNSHYVSGSLRDPNENRHPMKYVLAVCTK